MAKDNSQKIKNSNKIPNAKIKKFKTIPGVKLKTLTNHKDKRGFFREILRDDDNLLKRFGQVSISVTKPGVIKAFHFHRKQDDLWHVISGKCLAVLYDLRKNSKTYGKLQKLTLSSNKPQLLVVPKNVAHGYKVLGKKSMAMLYIMNLSYNRKNPDEGRIPSNSPEIDFNWKKYK